MRVVDLREISVPLEGNISNSLVNFSEHTISLVAVVTDVVRNGKPVTGVAFNSIGRFAQGGLLRERFFPRLLAAEPGSLLAADGAGFDPASVYKTLMKNEKPGGHGDRASAVGALELAFWDLNAKLADEPAYVTIARYFGRTVSSATAAVYAAGGYYRPDASLSIGDEIRSYRDLGFTDFKIKIGGLPLSKDMRRVEAALDAAGSGKHLSVDANGRFGLDDALDYARAMQQYGLRWYEEIGDPLDFDLNRQVVQAYSWPIATGENLFSAADVENLVRYAGMRPQLDYFQMDPGLSYGLTEFGRILQVVEEGQFGRQQMFPHGGHLINLHVVVGLGLGGCEAYPAVFQPFGGYPAECMLGSGLVAPTSAPGFGLEEKPELAPIVKRLVSK